MAENINQYLKSGKIAKYAEIKKGVPVGILKILTIPGMGPKTAALLFKEKGIKDINQLERAVKAGALRELPGMGKKKEENILRGIRLQQEMKGRILLGVAVPVVEEMIASLKKKGLPLVSPAGSLRRMKESLGDIDILVGAKGGKKIIADFVRQAGVKEVLASGDTKGSVIMEGDLQVDIRVVQPSSFGAALQYFTGSKAHNIRLREIAKGRGLKINEYGIFKGQKKIGGKREEDIYRILKLDWIPPVLREDRGEIEAARSSGLPRLVQLKDIKGDLHGHSNWSDGTATLAEIAEAGKKMGYQYIVVSDHSQSLKIAGGLSPGELEEQIRRIKELNKRLKGITLLSASEVDIKNDGSLDFPDKLLAKLDLVIGAIHSGFKQDEKTITSRIIKAMQNPNLDIIAHPTGRLIGAREAYQINLEEVFKAARDTQTAMEINSYYDRLDLNDVFCRQAKEKGVKLALGTDSHHPDQLWMIQLGLATAQRGWLEKNDILNTMSINELRKWRSIRRR